MVWLDVDRHPLESHEVGHVQALVVAGVKPLHHMDAAHSEECSVTRMCSVSPCLRAERAAAVRHSLCHSTSISCATAGSCQLQ